MHTLYIHLTIHTQIHVDRKQTDRKWNMNIININSYATSPLLSQFHTCYASLSGFETVVPVLDLVMIRRGVSDTVSVSACWLMVSLSVSTLGTTCKWLQFRSICPLGVLTMYDLGRSAGDITLPLTGSSSDMIQTSVSLDRVGRSLALCLESKFSFCFSFRALSCSLNFSRNGHWGLASCLLMAKKSLVSFPYRTQPDSSRTMTGVWIGNSGEQHSDHQPFSADYSLFARTHLSACPLLWGNLGLLVMCWNP